MKRDMNLDGKASVCSPFKDFQTLHHISIVVNFSELWDSNFLYTSFLPGQIKTQTNVIQFELTFKWVILSWCNFLIV